MGSPRTRADLRGCARIACVARSREVRYRAIPWSSGSTPRSAISELGAERAMGGDGSSRPRALLTEGTVSAVPSSGEGAPYRSWQGGAWSAWVHSCRDAATRGAARRAGRSTSPPRRTVRWPCQRRDRPRPDAMTSSPKFTRSLDGTPDVIGPGRRFVPARSSGAEQVRHQRLFTHRGRTCSTWNPRAGCARLVTCPGSATPDTVCGRRWSSSASLAPCSTSPSGCC